MDNEKKFWNCFVTMKKWMENRNSGKILDKYFEDYGYKSIAIYGAGDIGRLLYDEIKGSSVSVKYWIDRNGEGLREVNGINVLTLEEMTSAEIVDAIVITPLGNYDEINRDLVRIRPDIATISLQEAVYEL